MNLQQFYNKTKNKKAMEKNLMKDLMRKELIF